MFGVYCYFHFWNCRGAVEDGRNCLNDLMISNASDVVFVDLSFSVVVCPTLILICFVSGIFCIYSYIW